MPVMINGRYFFQIITTAFICYVVLLFRAFSFICLFIVCALYRQCSIDMDANVRWCCCILYFGRNEFVNAKDK